MGAGLDVRICRAFLLSKLYNVFHVSFRGLVGYDVGLISSHMTILVTGWLSEGLQFEPGREQFFACHICICRIASGL